jgi:hypothetical protein
MGTDRSLGRRLVRGFLEDQAERGAINRALGRRGVVPDPAEVRPADQGFAQRWKAAEELAITKGALPAFSFQATVLELAYDPDQPAVQKMAELIVRNAALIEEAITDGTWPGRDRVGRAGATAAEFLIAHADCYPALRERALGPFREAVLAGQADPRRYAHTVDRVCAHKATPQPYGTIRLPSETGMRFELPAEEPMAIDAHRAEIGLASLEEDARRFAEGAKPGPALGPFGRLDFLKMLLPLFPGGVSYLITSLAGQITRRMGPRSRRGSNG